MGTWLGLTHGSRNGHGTHRIELTHPGMGARLIADRTTLLHEMIHQALVEQGVNPHHDKEPWRAEITRLHAVLTGGERPLRAVAARDAQAGWGVQVRM
jgi:hypothetical protein